MIKTLLKQRIKHLILEAFKKAEAKHRRGNGEQCLQYAVDYIAVKVHLLPCFKNLLKEILQDEFSKHSVFINQMIIREKICL